MPVTVTIIGRPLRAGFIIGAPTLASVARAISVATAMWGGVFCPIIPTFQRLPPHYRFPHRPRRAASLAERLIDAFDPDLLVDLSNGNAAQDVLSRRDSVALKSDEWLLPEPWRPPSTLAALGHLWNEELRFRQHQERHLVLPTCSAHSTFFGAIFGSLPEPQMRTLEEHPPPGTLTPALTLESLPEGADARGITLIEVSSLLLRRNWGRGGAGGAGLFVMDPASPIDIIDFWNLRAAGMRLRALPAQNPLPASLAVFATEFLDRWTPPQDSTGYHRQPTVIRGRTVGAEAFSAFVGSITVGARTTEPSKRGWLHQDWVPVLSEDRHEECPAPVIFDERELEIPGDREVLDVPTLRPPFARDDGLGARPTRVANEIEFRDFSDAQFPRVFPSGSGHLPAQVFRHVLFDARLSRDGLVMFPGVLDRSMVGRPDGQKVVEATFRHAGVTTALSSAGLVAKGMLDLMGGPHRVQTLANKHVLTLLAKLHGARPVANGYAHSLCKDAAKLHNEQVGFAVRTGEDILGALVDANAVRFGFLIQCPRCRQRTWYALPELDYRLRCGTCAEDFRVPAHDAKRLEGAFRSHGPFAVQVYPRPTPGCGRWLTG